MSFVFKGPSFCNIMSADRHKIDVTDLNYI